MMAAPWAMRQARREDSCLPPLEGRNGVRIMALRPAAIRVVGNPWVDEPAGGRQEALGGKAELARQPEMQRRRCIMRRDGESLASLALRNGRDPVHP